MNNTPALIQNMIKTIMDSFQVMEFEVSSIYNAYWDTDANTLVSGLSGDGDGATYDTKFTKAIYLSAMTLIEDLEDFFGNEAVTTTDYLGTVNKIIYADAATPAKLSEATEEIGDRIKQVALDLLENLKQSNNVINIYFDNEIGDCVAVMDAQREFYGSEMIRADLADAITMLQQFMNLMNGSAVTTGDYSATINRWKKYQTINY